MKKFYTNLSKFTALLYLMADIILIRFTYIVEFKYELIGPVFTTALVGNFDESSKYLWHVGLFFGLLSLILLQLIVYILFQLNKELALRHVGFWRPIAILLSVTIAIYGLFKLDWFLLSPILLPAIYLIPPKKGGKVFPTVNRIKD